MTLMVVMAGGALGAVARLLLAESFRARGAMPFRARGAMPFRARGAMPFRARSALPWGTFVANVAGSFLAGLLAGCAAAWPGLPAWVGTLAGPGFCGALTTYSTLGLETVDLATAGDRRYALINSAGTLVAGLSAAWLGMRLAGLAGS